MDRKSFLSTLWIFLTVNYLFCDVFSLMNPEFIRQLQTGSIDGMEINQEFLLGFAFVLEIPMIMIVLAHVLKYKTNRRLNIAFGIFMALVQIWSLTTGGNTLHYWFFSAIEIATCFYIVWYAWTWEADASSTHGR